jgi:hypothetical protein
MNWSWAHAIHLVSSLDAANRVVIVGKNAPEVVAESFGAFVELYLTDVDGLYEGTAVDSP